MFTQVDRSMAGSTVLPQSSANPSPHKRTDGGNVQLMEARLVELYSSLRALGRSNDQLKEALLDDPNDSDFITAIDENLTAMRGQRELCMELVRDMKGQGMNIDLPEDICNLDVLATPTSQDQEESQSSAPITQTPTETDTGVYL